MEVSFPDWRFHRRGASGGYGDTVLGRRPSSWSFSQWTRGLPPGELESQEGELWLLYVCLYQITDQSIYPFCIRWSRWSRCLREYLLLFHIAPGRLQWSYWEWWHWHLLNEVRDTEYEQTIFKTIDGACHGCHGSPDTTERYRRGRRGTPKTVSETKAQAWNEFGEAMENNFCCSGKLFDGLRGGDETMHMLY